MKQSRQSHSAAAKASESVRCRCRLFVVVEQNNNNKPAHFIPPRPPFTTVRCVLSLLHVRPRARMRVRVCVCARVSIYRFVRPKQAGGRPTYRLPGCSALFSLPARGRYVERASLPDFLPAAAAARRGSLR